MGPAELQASISNALRSFSSDKKLRFAEVTLTLDDAGPYAAGDVLCLTQELKDILNGIAM